MRYVNHKFGRAGGRACTVRAGEGGKRRRTRVRERLSERARERGCEEIRACERRTKGGLDGERGRGGREREEKEKLESVKTRARNQVSPPRFLAVAERMSHRDGTLDVFLSIDVSSLEGVQFSRASILLFSASR